MLLEKEDQGALDVLRLPGDPNPVPQALLLGLSGVRRPNLVSTEAPGSVSHGEARRDCMAAAGFKECSRRSALIADALTVLGILVGVVFLF